MELKRIVLFLTIFSFTAGQRIDCYGCAYVEGDTTTDPKCQSNPSEVPSTTGCTMNRNSEALNKLFKNQTLLVGGEIEAYRDPVCYTSKGVTNGKKFVHRGCQFAPVPFNLEGVCINGKRSESNSEASICFCTKDFCNNATTIGNGSPGNGNNGIIYPFTLFTLLIPVLSSYLSQ